MKKCKGQAYHPLWKAGCYRDDDGPFVSIIVDTVSYHIYNQSDFEEFCNMAVKGELGEIQNFLCSSSIDFPEEISHKQEFLDLVDKIFNKS